MFGYPLSVAVSTLGDLYILDGENNRVVYFSFFGDYKGNFGGFGTGFYEFYRPEKISALKNAIAVADDDKLVLFDLFGTYLRNIQFQQRIRSVKYNDGKIAVVTKKEIYIAEDNLMYEFNQLDIEHDGVWFVDALMSGDKLYILTENSILFSRRDFDLPLLHYQISADTPPLFLLLIVSFLPFYTDGSSVSLPFYKIFILENLSRMSARCFEINGMSLHLCSRCMEIY